jgi:hypothetical protein
MASTCGKSLASGHMKLLLLDNAKWEPIIGGFQNGMEFAIW